jgi:hypothetical protein
MSHLSVLIIHQVEPVVHFVQVLGWGQRASLVVEPGRVVY